MNADAWFANVDWIDIGWASVDTLSMLGGALSLSVLLGLPLGVLLFLASRASCSRIAARMPCCRPS